MKPITASQLTIDLVMILSLVLELARGKTQGSLWITFIWVFIAAVSHIQIAVKEKKGK